MSDRKNESLSEVLSSLSEEHQKRVADALKRTIEGELIASANVQKIRSQDAGHSKTGVSLHSKCTHNHSKLGRIGKQAPARVDPARGRVRKADEDRIHEVFAARLLKLKSEMMKTDESLPS